MVTDLDRAGADPRLRRARVATLVSLGAACLTSLLMPVAALFVESRTTWIVLGAVGLCLYGPALGGALYAAATPWLSGVVRRRLLAAFGAAAALSVPLLGPVGTGEWNTWAWLGASIVGFVPLLVQPRTAVVLTLAVLAVAAGTALTTGGSVVGYLLITIGIGLAIAVMSALPVWLWDLLVQARAGRAAQARLAVTEERLRFARDVHDLLGHRLAVIALKAELAARLAPADAERAAAEAAEVQRLAASALTEVRQAVHGYRAVDLRDQLAAVSKILQSSGVRCTVTQAAGDLPTEVATQLALLLREASTNVLRHSRARWCTIDISRDGNEVRMTIANDGAAGAGPDRLSNGLRGAAERLSDLDGTLRTREENGRFTLEATLQAAS
ncbi:MAG TPA: histidine kinase [Kribbella sp.]|nr:histidine kinase [Kribbella sp.]